MEVDSESSCSVIAGQKQSRITEEQLNMAQAFTSNSLDLEQPYQHKQINMAMHTDPSLFTTSDIKSK